MTRTSYTLTAVAALLAVACGKGQEQAATPDSAAVAPAPPPPAGPQAIVTVIYKWPKDTAAFEKYYPTHLQIVGAGQAEIGFTKAELTRFVSALDGKKAEFYRQAELYFPDLEAAKKGMATEAFKKVGDDFKNFVADDGLIALVAVETGEKGEAACPALATVIYNQPTDTTAFEAYYPKHLEIVGAGKAEIGFVRADLTRFAMNLDGSMPAAKYRQAELCFESMDALKKGIATPAFKKVGDDFANFVTGGLTALIGVQQ